MEIKNKFIGLVLIILGVWPFLLKSEKINNFFLKYKILESFIPGEIVYQVILIVLGVALIWKIKTKTEMR